MPKPEPKPKTPFVCSHARRHMGGAVFKTYDTMVAMAKSSPTWKPGDPLIFYGKIRPTLVNATNTSETQLYDHIEQMYKSGWAIPGERQRWPNGRLGTVRICLLTHDLHVAKGGACPPAKYSEEGEIKTQGKKRKGHGTAQPFAFRKAAINRGLKAMLQTPEWERFIKAVGKVKYPDDYREGFDDTK